MTGDDGCPLINAAHAETWGPPDWQTAFFDPAEIPQDARDLALL